jgi:hypothetical protein
MFQFQWAVVDLHSCFLSDKEEKTCSSKQSAQIALIEAFLVVFDDRMQLGAILSCQVGSQEDTFLHCIPLYLPYSVIAAPKYRDLQWTSLLFYMAGFVDGFDSWILKRYVILLV